MTIHNNAAAADHIDPIEVNERLSWTSAGATTAPYGNHALVVRVDALSDPQVARVFVHLHHGELVQALYAENHPLGRESVCAVSVPASHIDTSLLEFQPTGPYQVAALANLGWQLMQEINAYRPGYTWHASPAEIIGALIEESSMPTDAATLDNTNDATAIAIKIVRDVAELDRDSPIDQPGMMLVTADELHAIVIAAIDGNKAGAVSTAGAQ